MATGAGQGGRILVVDDEPHVRDALARALMDEGYVVDVAGDGAEALDWVRAAKPDAVLLDLMMPGMNGRQFLQALRADAAYRGVPVLIMTAVQGLELNLASIGADDIVQKPFNINELMNKVALAVYRARGAESTPAPVSVPAAPERSVVDRGIVVVVERDRARLKGVDHVLSQRGYTVVSMTRAGTKLTRLARALKPLAVLLEIETEGVAESFQDLSDLCVLRYTRNAELPSDSTDALACATDASLAQFVDSRQ